MPWRNDYVLDDTRTNQFGRPRMHKFSMLDFGPTGQSFTAIANPRAVGQGGGGDYQELRERGRQFDITEGNRQNRFNTLYGKLTAMMDSPGVDVDIGKPPDIAVGDVFSPEQIREQRNAEMAEAFQGAAGRSARNRQRMATRGVGSPLLDLMDVQTEQIAAGQGAARGLDFAREASAANAEQRLRSGSLATQAYNDYVANQLQKEQIKATRANAILAALANLGF